MIDLSKVYEGWRNKLFPPAEMKDLITKVSEERMAICNACENISTKHRSIRPDVHCIDCGCTLSAKTKCLSCACPIGKWKEMMTDDEYDEIKQAIDGE
jgi:hypothetical protein